MIIMLGNREAAIFQFLWENPDGVYSIREVSRELGISYGSSWNILTEFRKKGITKGVKKLHSIDLESELTFRTWALLNATRKKVLETSPGYMKYWEIMNYITENSSAKFVALFGSMARLAATKESDIDVLICDPKKDVSQLNKKLKSRYFRTATITAVTKKELEKYLSEKREVYKEIWQWGIVWGDEDLFYRIFKNLWE